MIVRTIRGAVAARVPCTLSSVPITRCEAMGWLRSAVGVALVTAPRVPMRLANQEPTGADTLLMRTIGIRDLVLGLGTVAAVRAGDHGDIRRWIAAGLASDSLDAATSLASRRSIGTRDSVSAALLALAFACGDVWAYGDRPLSSKQDWRSVRPLADA